MDNKKLRDQLIRRTNRYASGVDKLYDQALADIARLFALVDYDPTAPFSFAAYGKMQGVDEIMQRLESQVQSVVDMGVRNEYATAYGECEELIRQVVRENVQGQMMQAFAPKTASGTAAQRFLLANQAGDITASQRVWNGAVLGQMETAVQEGLMEGMPAKRMATQLKRYLVEPDNYFRRFRIKTGESEAGESIYGRKWKKRIRTEDGSFRWIDADPDDYPSGQGIYHSSYKNALRYTRTTTNIAYRTADYDRYQELPFVIGIEIRLSNNPKHVPDVCDDLAGQYPKDFKWTGWHPNCMCYQIPLLAKKDEVDQMVDAVLDGRDPEDVECRKEVTEMPENFKNWLLGNEQRYIEAKQKGTLPYFVRDNAKYVGHIFGYDVTTEEVARMISEAGKPYERRLFVSFEPFSTAIIEAVRKAGDKKAKKAIYESVMTDERSELLNDVNGHQTRLFAGHKGKNKPTWNATKDMAFRLNELGIDVTFLPEHEGSKGLKSADALIRIGEKYFLADFKFAVTHKWNTLQSDLADGFTQAGTVILKLTEMDRGQFQETIDYMVRNNLNIGDLIMLNEYNKSKFVSKQDILSGRYQKKIKGFL